MADPGSVRLSIEGHVARVEFDRPAARNALTTAMWGQLEHAVGAIEADRTVRVVVFSGRGGAFCAGVDRNELATMMDSRNSERILRNAGVIRSIRRLTAATIAAVDGPGYGMGFILALNVDLVVATSGSRFCLPEARLGLADTIHSPDLVRCLGPVRAFDLLACCRVLDADEAQRWGLVARVVPGAKALEPLVGELSEQLAETPPPVVAALKSVIAESRLDGDPRPMLEAMDFPVQGLGR